MGGNVLAAGTAAQILFGVFFTLLVLRAGKEAGAYGRQIESGEDEQKLAALEKAGKLKRVPFADRAAMKKAVDPVMAAYAKEIGAEQILAKINAIK